MQSRRSGMILLLVIALLVLLALMGTVFILMASADRKSAYASNSTASLNMAQQGVLNTVRGLMLSQTLDENGQTLAVGSYNATTGVYTPDSYSAVAPAQSGQIARFWDYPETGAMPSGSTPAQFYQTAIVAGASVVSPTQYAPSEPWLVSNQPYEPGNYYVPGEEVYFGNPSTGATGRAVYIGAANKFGVGYPLADTTDWTTTVAAPTYAPYAVASGQTTNGEPLISALSPYLYDPVSGGYDIPWGFAALPPGVRVPNAAVVEPHWVYNKAYNPSLAEASGNMPVAPFGDLDAMWNLLPYSDPNGTRYRFAVRIMDTSSLLNLNTGWIANAYTNAGSNSAEATDPYGIYGAYIGSAPILNQAGINIDPTDFTAAASGGTPVQIGGGPSGTTPGRIGNYPNTTTFYSLPAWHTALAEYELQFPSSGPPSYTYPTAPPAAFTTALFGTNSAMDLLTGAGAGGEAFGSPYFSRVAALMPNTLGMLYSASNGYYGSGYRGLYTTYSFGRDVAPINPGTATTGTAPPKVNLNAIVTSATSLQSLADNLYTTLVASGYNVDHAREFLADYFTYRFGTTDYSTSPATLGASNLLTVPMGGSTISTTLGTSVPAGVACVGTTAQPFLNEVEVQLTEKKGVTDVTDWAIELANPFPGANALPCGNYSLAVYFGGSKTAAFTIALGGSLSGYGTSANGNIGVVALKGGKLYSQASGDADGFVQASTDAFSVGTVTIDLQRNNLSGGLGTATVDSMTIDIPQIPAASTTPLYYDVSRDDTVSAGGMWGCDSAAAYATPTAVAGPVGSIGTSNGTVATGGNPGVVLYDRWYSGDQVAPGAFAGAYLANIDDLNCIARECTTTTEPLSQQIDTNIAAAGPHTVYVPPANLGMYYVAHAQALGDPVIPAIAPAISPELSGSALYFDFAYDPRAAYNAADAGFGVPEIALADTGEIPPTFLSCTTLTDRSQSNPTAEIALPEGATDLVRQAGKININTAGAEVLYSAFSEDGALWNTSATPPLPTNIDQLVVDAIGFRDRLAAGATVAPFAATVPTGYTVGGTGYSGFGGVGYQSPADLLVAFIPTIDTANALYAGSVAPTTIQQRDAAWADVENFITIRSDTFAVYGLVQALRLNPAYSTAYAAGNAVYSPADWYNANQGIVVGTGTVYNEGSISTDPTNQNAEFILEGSRRFIAIVDRSYCNNGGTVQPHIVALKILPQ